MRSVFTFLNLLFCFFFFSQVKETPANAIGTVTNYALTVDGQPFDSKYGYGSGKKHFFIFKNNEGDLMCMWQDANDKLIKLTIFSSDLSSQKTMVLSKNEKSQLLAATTDSVSCLYYLVSETKNKQVILTLNKTDLKGKAISGKSHTSLPNTLNIFSVDDGICSMNCNKESVVMILSRLMFASDDGLNHQAGLIVNFDSKTLDVKKIYGNTTSHSFGNYLIKNSKGGFVGMELGDNYPRGVNLHKLTEKNLTSRVIYTYKTFHATSPNNFSADKPFPLYAEISKGNKKFYKWSNDNATYSGLGGIVEVADGYMVFFTGEVSPAGKSLDNSRIGTGDPSNIGFVKVKKDFENVFGNGNCVNKDMILSKGITEDGGFYTYGGEWTPQKNTGVTWLTNYKAGENADNVKSIKLKDGSILILWNKSSGGVYAMKLKADGEKIIPFALLSNDFKLSAKDEILYSKNKLFVMSGSREGNKLNVSVITLND